MQAGLRIDVDTYRGTRLGVPRLCEVLAKHSVKATFYFSVGPDNMGRHIWRVLRPTFLWKMLRTKAGSTYGWDIIFRGTFWPGPLIGKHLEDTIRAAAAAGHEMGLHAWDHQRWQAKLDSMSSDRIADELTSGFQELQRILGKPPACSATPAWMTNDLVMREKRKLPFVHNSDCRGKSIFIQELGGNETSQPQIPTTLPTYDEIIGSNGITNANYNEHMLSLFKPGQLNVLTIHAEVEGNKCAEMFDSFLAEAGKRDINFVPLGELLRGGLKPVAGRTVKQSIPGRDGWVATQA